MIEGKYNKWIVILQEFDLKFVSTKSKKYLIFAELISDFPSEAEEFPLITILKRMDRLN